MIELANNFYSNETRRVNALLNDIDSFVIDKSPIHGKGIFANKKIFPREILFSSGEYIVYNTCRFATVQKSVHEHLLEEKAIRWINHSCKSNSYIKFVDNQVQIIALSVIFYGDEVTCDYLSTEHDIPISFICNCGHCNNAIIWGK